MNTTLLSKESHSTTPMMKQYFSIKEAHREYMLFYRMGDFYELFFEDAVIASKELDIVLTSRGKHIGNDIPMCGVPAHAGDGYLHKLLKNGHSIAICEQLESPEEAKKRGYKAVVRREVTRIITPGTLTEETLLSAGSNNYLCAIAVQENLVSIAWIDISTGDFSVSSVELAGLSPELARLSPAEIIISDKLTADETVSKMLQESSGTLTQRPASIFQYDRSENRVKHFFGLASTSGLGSFTKNEIVVTGVLLEYLEHTQKGNLPKLTRPKKVQNSDYMMIDPVTRRHLEIDQSAPNRQNSLLRIINKTITAGGSRLMNIYLASPLVNPDAINKRLDSLEYFFNNYAIMSEIREELKKFHDIERALLRISTGRGTPRELAAINLSMRVAINIAELLRFSNTELTDGINSLISQIGVFGDILDALQNALAPDAISGSNDVCFLRKGYSRHLDQLYALQDSTLKSIETLKSKYQNISGINNLKLVRNNIIGYFIEVSPSNAQKMQDQIFIHKQSLGTAIRYTTEELKKLETDLLVSSEKIKNLEQELLQELCAKTLEVSDEIFLTAESIANLDVITTLAYVAKKNNYSRPCVDNSQNITITKGRHPIVESNTAIQFIANDCLINENSHMILLTGPNMAGKSTFLRQNALIIIMAQIGSFVPAESARIGVVDKLFSRIGSGDNISAGQSTFMTEMLETSYILNNATKNSLLILDEVGRGTSTYDGVAIAWSVLEYIHDNLGSRTLFATHYHELTELEGIIDKLLCYSMNVKEWNSQVIFLHEIVIGKADKSYGVHVAELAGMPQKVTKRAAAILNELTSKERNTILSIQNKKSDIEAQEIDKLRQKIGNIDIDAITPKDALSILYELKELV